MTGGVEGLRATADRFEQDAEGRRYGVISDQLNEAAKAIRGALSRIEMLEADLADDTVLRSSKVDEHGVAPDGSVWRNILIDGVHYEIPYEVAMAFVRKGDRIEMLEGALKEAESWTIDNGTRDPRAALVNIKRIARAASPAAGGR